MKKPPTPQERSYKAKKARSTEIRETIFDLLSDMKPHSYRELSEVLGVSIKSMQAPALRDRLNLWLCEERKPNRIFTSMEGGERYWRFKEVKRAL